MTKFQRVYALVLAKGLGLDQNTNSTNKTYIQVIKTNNQIIFVRTTFLRSKFNLEVNEENNKLPNIYWAPKLHKHVSKARFVIAAIQCFVRHSSKAFTFVLKLVYK